MSAPCYPAYLTRAGQKVVAHCHCGWRSSPRANEKAARDAIECEHGWTTDRHRIGAPIPFRDGARA